MKRERHLGIKNGKTWNVVGVRSERFRMEFGLDPLALTY